MAKAKASVIVLKGDPIYKEYPLGTLGASAGGGAITPGMLVELDSGGDVIPHATQLGFASPMFAVEGLNVDPDSKTMGGIEDDYDTDGQAVKVGVFEPGSEVNALLVAGETAVIGSLLASASDGYLMVSATNPVARALEAINNAAGVTPARIIAEVL